MIIRFERTGGFSGLALRTVIDTTGLQPAEHQNLRSLVSSAGFFQLPAHLPVTKGSADRFAYKITVEDAEGSHTVEGAESSLPASLQPLIDQLVVWARSQPKG